MAKPHRHSVRPFLEHLEDRRLLDAGLTVTASLLGHLSINGTERDDTIIVDHRNGRISVRGVRIQTPSGYVDSVSDLDVGRIYINGYRGNDVIRIEDGDGAGNHLNDTFINGDDGNDILVGGQEWNSINGGKGDDYIDGGDGVGWLDGGEGNDTIHGGADGDFISGGFGKNRLFGGGGDDRISAGEDGDLIVGGDGRDRMYGGSGGDRMIGGPGNDDFFLGEGDDWADGGPGNDWFGDKGGDDVILGGIGNDIILAGDGNDRVDGGAGDDLIYGEAGDDILVGGPGRDSISALPGRDLVYQEAALARIRPDGVRVNFVNGTLTVTGTVGSDDIQLRQESGLISVDGLPDLWEGVRKIVVNAGNGNDQVKLDSETVGGEPIQVPAVLLGGAGDDLLIGGHGNDYLDGGIGAADVVDGNEGADSYRHWFNPRQPVVNGTNRDDIDQEGAPNCAFTASLAGHAASGANLAGRIRFHGYTARGYLYTVGMYTAAGAPVRWPVYFTGVWTDADAQPAAPGEFWVILYDRAYKGLMAWQGLNPEDTQNAMRALTGNPPFARDRSDSSAASAFTDDDIATVAVALQAGRVVVVGTLPAQVGQPPAPLVSGHAYTVVAVDPAGQRVLLRNPMAVDGSAIGQSLDGGDDGYVWIPNWQFQSWMKYYVISQ